MCGFVGFAKTTKDNRKIIKDMADIIKHRGPDDEGFFTDDYVSLGFRRLSIIDLNTGSQPIYNEDLTKVIVFNGEIYNYQEIRKDLEKKGHNFQTKTDTEVILHGYEEYKEKILDKLRGMFAFIIYDKETKTLFGARDFFGIKPLYYGITDNMFIFGSEIKSFFAHPDFKKEFNRDVLDNYLTFQYNPSKETFFKNVYKLTPGHYFIYKDHELIVNPYYEVSFEPQKQTLDSVKKNIKNTLDDSIKAHKISDVEVGSFLSSGVDSSLIATLAKVDKTFTVGFDNAKYNEISYAKELSKNIKVKNTDKVVTKEEYFDIFPTIQYYMDEPLADPSAVSLYFVANLASQQVKVALSGEGADEIFGGYNIYQEPYSVSWYYKIPFPIRWFIGKCATLFKNHWGFNFLIRRGQKLSDRYIGNAFIFDEKEIKKITSYNSNPTFKKITEPFYKKCQKYDEVTTMQYIDFNTWLINDILLKADKMSMANSLEVRVPYLDKEVMNYAKTIPTNLKVTESRTKYAFREVASEVLADKVANKKKLGFPTPIRTWLQEDDIYNRVKITFSNATEFFNTKEIIKLLDDHKNNVRDNSRKIWTIYTFLTWYQVYFKDLRCNNE